ncbi:MAG TPA: DUF1156 domain-containing protein [Methylococcus sp.]|nr:DUF1156 domain-containing protein [Methylococcus sp.]
MTPYPKRLIEVDLPIKRISAHSRREKSIRYGHISTLHIWWARTGAGVEPGGTAVQPQPVPTSPVTAPAKIAGIRWSGEVPPQKWMNFYTKVLSRFVATQCLKLTIAVEVSPPDGLSKQSLEETQDALRELGLEAQVTEK